MERKAFEDTFEVLAKDILDELPVLGMPEEAIAWIRKVSRS
jgi:hypothetical protein